MMVSSAIVHIPILLLRQIDRQQVQLQLQLVQLLLNQHLQLIISNNASEVLVFGSLLLMWILVLCRTLIVDIPLSLLFGAFGVTLCLQSIYKEYYVPLMDRSTRTDEDLYEEFTYYHRRCTARDITTTNLTQLFVDIPSSDAKRKKKNNNNNHPPMDTVVDTAQDLLMMHGLVLLPQILSSDTVQKLREYAVYRNRVIPEHEEYPVSQGHNRISFGYDATEHPAIIQAVREVTHNVFLQQLLQQVLGDHDPASTEITTITQWHGAPPQAWHSDTKEDGNALKFARTYSHSYSLFLPLQNTTRGMGATEVCPGTHYCANDLGDVCDSVMKGRGLQSAYHPNPVVPAGDGALLNQHVWHRGAPHRDRHAQERVMFVMSFIARPKSGDTRQLSRGTYFHQKWNMWGHTWRDLMDPIRYMKVPYSYFKCFGLWAVNQNWGYDLVTATYMRFSNSQLGDDLTRLVDIWDNVLDWPPWLHGPNLEYEVEEKEAWQTFIKQTIDNIARYAGQVALVVYAVYHLIVLVPAGVLLSFGPTYPSTERLSAVSFLGASVKRLVTNNVIIAMALVWILCTIHSSDWAQDAVNGRILMRPFPPVSQITLEQELVGIVSSGPTTYPSSVDVLVGTRFDAPWLGAYEHWLDGHPGNQRFRQMIKRFVPMYKTIQIASTFLDERQNLVSTLVDSVITATTDETGGRFLHQDYRTGDWRIQTIQETERTVQLELTCLASPLLSFLRTTLDRTIALYRFGSIQRSTALARKAAVYTWLLRWRLAGISVRRQNKYHSSSSSSAFAAPRAVDATTGPDATTINDEQNPIAAYNFLKTPALRSISKQTKLHTMLKWRSGWPMRKTESDLMRVGNPVWLYMALHDYDGFGDAEMAWFRGDIVAMDEKGHAAVALENGDIVHHVPEESLERYQPVQEGDIVNGCFSSLYILEDCFEGIVVNVMPDGAVSIAYDDGDFDPRKSLGQYFVPPYAYVLPEDDDDDYE